MWLHWISHCISFEEMRYWEDSAWFRLWRWGSSNPEVDVSGRHLWDAIFLIIFLLTMKTVSLCISLLLSNHAGSTSNPLLRCWFITKPARHTICLKEVKAFIFILQILLFCKTLQLQKRIHAIIKVFFSKEKTLYDFLLVLLVFGAKYKEEQIEQQKFSLKWQNQ